MKTGKVLKIKECKPNNSPTHSRSQTEFGNEKRTEFGNENGKTGVVLKTKLLFLAIVFGFCWLGALVKAQGGYPQSTDRYVNDYAGVLTGGDSQKIRTMFANLEEQTGIEAVAVTIDSIRDYDTRDETIETFATHLFNTWGIGDRVKNNGVLILVAIQDRAVRIELGAGYGREYNTAMKRVIDGTMIPAFRQNDYSRGIYQGSRAAIAGLTGVWPEISFTERLADIGGGMVGAVSDFAGNYPCIAWGGGILATIISGFRLRQYWRDRPRRCPNCRTSMTRLGEIADNVYLDSGQKAEELLKAVDYDIWKCPTCGAHELYRYSAFFSEIKRCPQCGYRTVKSSTKTLQQATYKAEGRAQVTRTCRHCQYQAEEIIVLPKLVHSSSSGSSSSSSSSSSRSSSGGSSSRGGGSSSGGGASGRW
jgi:uncharacterized protein